jgi:hypothetical protein
VLAVGRNVLEIAYHLLGEQTTYRELGIDYFDRYRAERLKAPQPRSTPAPWLPGHSYTSPNRRLRRIFQDRDRGYITLETQSGARCRAHNAVGGERVLLLKMGDRGRRRRTENSIDDQRIALRVEGILHTLDVAALQ